MAGPKLEQSEFQLDKGRSTLGVGRSSVFAAPILATIPMPEVPARSSGSGRDLWNRLHNPPAGTLTVRFRAERACWHMAPSQHTRREVMIVQCEPQQRRCATHSPPSLRQQNPNGEAPAVKVHPKPLIWRIRMDTRASATSPSSRSTWCAPHPGPLESAENKRCSDWQAHTPSLGKVVASKTEVEGLAQIWPNGQGR